MGAFSLFYLVCSIFNLFLEFKWKTRADVSCVYLEMMGLEDFDFHKFSCIKISPVWASNGNDFISSQEMLHFLFRVCFSTRVWLWLDKCLFRFLNLGRQNLLLESL